MTEKYSSKVILNKKRKCYAKCKHFWHCFRAKLQKALIPSPLPPKRSRFLFILPWSSPLPCVPGISTTCPSLKFNWITTQLKGSGVSPTISDQDINKWQWLNMSGFFPFYLQCLHLNKNLQISTKDEIVRFIFIAHCDPLAVFQREQEWKHWGQSEHSKEVSWSYSIYSGHCLREWGTPTGSLPSSSQHKHWSHICWYWGQWGCEKSGAAILGYKFYSVSYKPL